MRNLNIKYSRQILRICLLLLMIPVCASVTWIGLLAFGIFYGEISAHQMQPSFPFETQLIDVYKFGGSDGQTEVKTYYTSMDLDHVLATMQSPTRVFTKSVDAQDHEVYRTLIEDRSLPMQIVSQTNIKDGIPATFPSVGILIEAGRGVDSTGTTLIVSIDWSTP